MADHMQPMSGSEPDDQGFPDGESGTPWGSPGGAIKRWIRRCRASDAEDSSATNTESES
jgi:hypothetical protein